MAAQTVEFRAATGLTLTAKLFTAGNDTEVASVSATEATNRKGTYSAAYTDVAAGEYQLIALDGTTPVASWWVTLTLTTATYEVYEKANKLAIADAVWDEPYAGHTTAGTFGKLMDVLRKANMVVDGVVTSAVTPSTTVFSSDVNYPTGAFKHAVLLWVNGSSVAEQNSPILTYVNTNGVITVEEPFTSAPQIGDQFIIIPTTHVHSIAAIQSGLATSTQLTTVENKVDAIDNFVDTEVAAIKATTDKLDTTVELDGAVYRFTANALEQAPSGGGGGTGTGARTVTITVDDGTNPLENARVRVTSGAETYVTSTDVSGAAVFNLDDATWVVSITKPGYTFAGASLVVNGTETVTYSMSLVVITPSSVDKVTGYWTVLDETGSAAASVVVTIKARQPLRGGSGLIHDAGERTVTSNGSGLVQFTNLIPGWRYAVVANDDYVADFVVPADAVTSVELGSIVARLP